jgi:hypothetical protein
MRLSTFILFLLVFQSFCGKAQKETEIMKRYDVKFVYQSEHFIYYAAQKDYKYVHLFDSVLNANYERICTDFGHFIKGKIEIEIYPDNPSFRKAAGYSDGVRPDVIAAAHVYRHIIFTSPSLFDYPFMVTTIQHEFAHAVMYDFVGKKNIDKVPFWLAEGFAEREANANTLSTSGQGYFLEKVDSISSFDRFDNDTQFLTIPFSYAWARQLCDYLIETKGISVIKLLAYHPEKFESIVGKTKDEFYIDFVAHLKQICRKCLFCSCSGMNDSLLAANREKFNQKYTAAVNKGDSLFKAGQYEQAIISFQESLLYGFQYSVKFGGIPDANKRIDAKARKGIYNFDIMKADKLFTEGNFACAKQYYQFALYFFKDEVYPKDKIMECDDRQKPN